MRVDEDKKDEVDILYHGRYVCARADVRATSNSSRKMEMKMHASRGYRRLRADLTRPIHTQ